MHSANFTTVDDAFFFTLRNFTGLSSWPNCVNNLSWNLSICFPSFVLQISLKGALSLALMELQRTLNCFSTLPGSRLWLVHGKIFWHTLFLCSICLKNFLVLSIILIDCRLQPFIKMEKNWYMKDRRPVIKFVIKLCSTYFFYCSLWLEIFDYYLALL